MGHRYVDLQELVGDFDGAEELAMKLAALTRELCSGSRYSGRVGTLAFVGDDGDVID